MTLLCLCPVGCLSLEKKLNWDSQQSRDRATSGCNKKNFNLSNLILIFWGKSGIIKLEFKPTMVSLSQTYSKYNFIKNSKWIKYLISVHSTILWLQVSRHISWRWMQRCSGSEMFIYTHWNSSWHHYITSYWNTHLRLQDLFW